MPGLLPQAAASSHTGENSELIEGAQEEDRMAQPPNGPQAVTGPGLPHLVLQKGYTMNSSRLIEHPLDRFLLTGSLRDLDWAGRDATDKLMTMIDDMRFRKDSIWGTCARYFLLIDLSWFPQLCLSAQINSEKLRAYLWLCERGEIKHIFDDAGTVVPFLRKRGQSGTQPTDKVVPSGPFAATKKSNP